MESDPNHWRKVCGSQFGSAVLVEPQDRKRIIADREQVADAFGNKASDARRRRRLIPGAQAHVCLDRHALVPSGICQAGATVPLQEPAQHLAAVVADYQRRRDETLAQLEGFPVVTSSGGWSLLMDTAALGIDCAEASKRMLEQKVAATQMRGWGGEVADRCLRFVYSNEPIERLSLLGDRARAALG